MTDRFAAEPALRPLKSFQRATVDYVSRRLLSDPDPVRHFLVADEVGLGKTMVARGVIARTIEALQDDVKRIDIVYICSNGAIARQNVARLNVMGEAEAHVLPTRLTMLAIELAKAGGIKPEGVNFFSLTPGTSLDLKSGGGMKEERALILRLLWGLLEDRRAVAKMLQGYAGQDGWRASRDWIVRQPLEQSIVKRFVSAASARPDLLAELEACAQAYKGMRGNNTELNRRREAIVGEFRSILARESAEALEPDLIVLDEFQRFTEVLNGDGEAADLARKLFDAEGPEGSQPRVLLLSATPYKMLYLRDDEADSGDHYKEFLDVIGFLFGDRGEEVRAELEQEMRRFRLAMLSLPASADDARTLKSAIESTLRQVIARTERVTETADHDAMMRDIDVPVSLEPADLLEARAIARVAEAADAPGTVEYWKSAPYLLSFLRDYKLGQKLDAQRDNPSEDLRAAIRGARDAQLDPRKIESYAPVPLPNGRMRALRELAFENDLARRLWMPPSLPYFGRPVVASKLLLFSQWTMVPDAVAALLSYESERQMNMPELGHAYSDAFRKQTQLLNFRHARERLTGLRALSLVIPSPALAEAVDPLAIWRENDLLIDEAAMRAAARQHLQPLARTIRRALEPVQRSSSGALPEDDSGTSRAEAWDWACAAWLDKAADGYVTWLRSGAGLQDVLREDGMDAWMDHVSALAEVATAEQLAGTPTDDALLDHLTDLALGSPATCALRALHRVAPALALDNPALLTAAAKIGMAFRGLFNQPESQALLRGDRDTAYWRSALRYGVSHDLQSVLDEYVHILLEAEGLSDASPVHAVSRIAETIDEAMSLRPATISIRNYKVRSGRLKISEAFHMRGRFATRLLQKAQEGGAVQRTDLVRSAFNSPFRPFVLASTSVGQEGLDFHPYCHRLVHWNLPSNPVDLEQREGRVHRYKNHAVRLNLARQEAMHLKEAPTQPDPWAQMFHLAHSNAKRPGDLEPFWLLDGTTCIERFSLNLPFSKEIALLGWLKRSVALYRLAFGQPRQDDLLAYLEKLQASGGNLDLDALQICLRPPAFV